MSEISNKRVEKAWQRRLVLLRLLNNSTRGIPFSDSLCGTASLQIDLFSIAADDDDDDDDDDYGDDDDDDCDEEAGGIFGTHYGVPLTGIHLVVTKSHKEA